MKYPLLGFSEMERHLAAAYDIMKTYVCQITNYVSLTRCVEFLKTDRDGVSGWDTLISTWLIARFCFGVPCKISNSMAILKFVRH